MQQMQQQRQQQHEENGFLAKLFGGNQPKPDVSGRMIKPRKAPVKVEPKVFFANERTFLAWMHLSVMLAGASIAILAFAEEQNPFSQIYGVILLPVAIAFIVYSMYQCKFNNNNVRRILHVIIFLTQLITFRVDGAYW